MKVLLISDVQRKGGAGIAAHRLACALRSQGHDVHWATPYPDQDSVIATHNCRDVSAPASVAHKLALSIQPKHKQSMHVRAITRQLNRIIREYQPDVVNVHNLHGADLPATLPAKLSRHVPVVWTLHDMWAFTGTCAYAMTCDRFTTACDAACPMAQTYPMSPTAQVPKRFEDRQQALSQAGRIAYATPSRWLAEQAQRGMLHGYDVRTIPNCVELDQFKPIEQDAARKALNLPVGRPILISAATAGDPRKGASILYEALAGFDRPNTILLQLGGNADDASGLSCEHRILQNIHDPRLMRIAYSAADVHVLPTLADNLPNTLLEAAACGVPSIGSNVGGVGEAIREGETGWLVPSGDPDALASCIRRVIDMSTQQADDCRRACRTYAEANFAPSLQARRYAELFVDTIRQTDLSIQTQCSMRGDRKEAA